MKKRKVFIASVLTILVTSYSSCKFSNNHQFEFKKTFTVEPANWTKLAEFEDGLLKLKNDSIFDLDNIEKIRIRDIIKKETLVVEIDNSDCGVCIKTLIDILKSSDYKDKPKNDIIIIVSGYSPHEALFFKKSFEIPFSVFISEMPSQINLDFEGPKLFIVTEKYIVRDKFIPQFDNPGNTELYLNQVLLLK